MVRRRRRRPPINKRPADDEDPPDDYYGTGTADIERGAPGSVRDWVSRYQSERKGWKKAQIREQARKSLSDSGLWAKAKRKMDGKKKEPEAPAPVDYLIWNTLTRYIESMAINPSSFADHHR
jgi:hypothetical protein